MALGIGLGFGGGKEVASHITDTPTEAKRVAAEIEFREKERDGRRN